MILLQSGHDVSITWLKLSVVDVVLKRLYKTFNGVNETGNCAYASDDENGNVEEDVVPQEISPLELQVEEAWQEEAQASPGETPS